MADQINGSVDPETLFLYSDRKTSNEWELFKENVRPLKRGRDVRILNDALKSQTDGRRKISLLETRRRLIQAIDEYKGEDPLHPWLECIKWVQEAFPSGGDSSGLIVIYEECVRTFWHSDRYRDDLRYLKVWLEYAENCADAEVIFSFLEANKIGQTHSVFFIAYALHMESKNKNRTANEIFNRGISKKAQPMEKLEAAYRKFFARSMGKPKVTNEDPTEDCLPPRTFGTVLTRGENRRLPMGNSDLLKKNLKPDRSGNESLSVYKDSGANVASSHQADMSVSDLKPWPSLGSRVERNKENNQIPAKWKTYKVPQSHGSTAGAPAMAAGACIEVFVDEECAETQKMDSESEKSLSLQGRGRDGIKKEGELLRKNPLRNFPPISRLPR